MEFNTRTEIDVQLLSIGFPPPTLGELRDGMTVGPELGKALDTQDCGELPNAESGALYDPFRISYY